MIAGRQLNIGLIALAMAGLAVADERDERWTPDKYRDLFTEAEAKQPHVRPTSHDLREFPFLDGQWLGILADSDGDVWFGVSSHSKELPAQLFVYKQEDEKVHHVADLDQVCGEKLTGNPPQDKIHTPMFQDGDSIYCGTCEGHTIPGNPYKGGYYLRINRKTGIVENMGKSMTNDGLLGMSYDPDRGVLYGHTNRSGELTEFDLETREERVIGVPWQDVIDRWKASDAPDKPKQIWVRNADHMRTSDGRIIGVMHPPGKFWCYNPGTDEITTFRVDMPPPRDIKVLPETTEGLSSRETKQVDRTRRQWERSAFHRFEWDEQDQCFYIIRSFDQMLCRFYPPDADGQGGRIETIHEMGKKKRLWGNRPAACTIDIIDRTVYYTPTTGWGGTVNLTSYNLETETFTNHGPIICEGGRRNAEIHSMDAGKDGRLYAVTFTYSIENVDPVRRWAMRGAYPFHPRFIIIDPETDLITP